MKLLRRFTNKGKCRNMKQRFYDNAMFYVYMHGTVNINYPYWDQYRILRAMDLKRKYAHIASKLTHYYGQIK